MTKLIVTPIDTKAPGSYKARKQLLGIARRLDSLRDGGGADWKSVIDAYDALEELLLPRLRTDDGTPIQEALEQLSADEFDGLIGNISFGAESVPPVSASGSSSPSEDTESPPTG